MKDPGIRSQRLRVFKVFFGLTRFSGSEIIKSKLVVGVISSKRLINQIENIAA